ncbi:hypothetical protein CEXT_538711 [Caerostris extrusa]|uniref:Uncharacterized protein n=1 Tax=Caerostris extrusa TaxID=172846 RepID=A0AAV4Y2Y6_CAEEX|nr:hypothetical protein CEXT_538711 [Caerostris extrusa]
MHKPKLLLLCTFCSPVNHSGGNATSLKHLSNIRYQQRTPVFHPTPIGSGLSWNLSLVNITEKQPDRYRIDKAGIASVPSGEKPSRICKSKEKVERLSYQLVVQQIDPCCYL